VGLSGNLIAQSQQSLLKSEDDKKKLKDQLEDEYFKQK
jgi:hypothetical protein